MSQPETPPEDAPRRGRGRPPGRSPDALTVRAEVWLSPAEAVALDARRGELSRSEYIARALGLRG